MTEEELIEKGMDITDENFEKLKEIYASGDTERISRIAYEAADLTQVDILKKCREWKKEHYPIARLLERAYDEGDRDLIATANLVGQLYAYDLSPSRLFLTHINLLSQCILNIYADQDLIEELRKKTENLEKENENIKTTMTSLMEALREVRND